MAYFNHAYSKMFLGTGPSRTAGSTGAAITTSNPASTGGMLTTTGTPSVVLANLPLNNGALPHTGYFGFFDPKTYLLIDPTLSTYECCPIVLASSSVLQKDKIGPFHGGYQETNKSKTINPKYVQNAYNVTTCVPQQAIISIGNTPQTSDGVLTVNTLTLGTETYVNGTYTNINLTGGSGSGTVQATVVVAGNVVTSVTITSSGINYVVADVLTLSSAAVATPGSLTELVAGTATTIQVATIATTTAVNFQGGTTSATCCFEFYCGETYYLRIDIKGSPALRALNHNAYQTLDAYTGCCSGPTPTLVDSTLVMISWAKELIINNYLKPFALPVVFDEAGVAWYAPGTTVDPISGAPVISAQWWDAYVSPGHVAGLCAGLRIFGAFVGTVFGDCTFQVTDYFEKEPVKLYASMVDYTGDPCVFEGICVYNDCLGLQGMGFGDQIVKDLVLAESYLQNFFANNDLRIREITQGYDMTSAINRNALYTRYFILHSIPRWNNPTGTFDADRYMLEIIVPEANPLIPVGITSLDTFLTNWLDSCATSVPLESKTCVRCVPVAN